MKARALKLAMIILLSITGSSKAQPVYSVQRGERPPIDIESISNDAYEPGMIRIKVYPQVKSLLSESQEKGEQSPFVKTGHNDFDMLNRTFEVSRYTQAISSLYLADTNSEKFTERHKAWGLDLWYELKLDSKADVISAVKQFTDLKDVEIAELVFKKQLVADDPDFHQKELKEGQPNGRSDCWTPNDTQYSNQWHYSNFGQQGGTPGADISLEEAWGLEKGNPAVIVAIIDGGIQYDHQDLAANMWPGTGFNFVTNTSSISPHNHGTHVAGTVAAVSNNSVGVAGVAGGSGLADGVKLMSCQVFSNSGNGGFHLAPIFAADNGAAISQNSWGYTSAGVYEQLVLDAIDYFNANGGGSALEGGLTIFAAGNGNSSGQWYPACYPGVFSVAATNNQDVKAWYSNFDTWVDISAPGGETNSVPSRGVLSTLTNNTYGYYQGTSMACPHVSGVAALIVSSAYGLLTAADVSEILRNSADDHYDANPLYAGNLGAGRLNAYAALIETQNMLNGVMNPVSFTAQAITTSKISLDWTPNVNDHDVMIAWSQDGVFGEPEEATQYFPGQLIPGGGNVVYRGSGCSFLHEGLQTATMYYYKIWSFNGIDKYSAGRAAHAITQCESENLLPFNENFDVCTSMPICWDVADNIGNGQVWMFGVFTGKVAGTTGNVAFVNSSTYGYGNSQNTDLITPTLDLTNYQNVRLKFKHYFRQYQSASIASVSYSLDNGSTWTNIQTWSTTSANPSIFNMIIPDIAGQSEVRIKWNYSGTWGYFWSIDDVEILGTYSPPPPVPDFFADQTITNLGNSVNFISNVGTQIISSYEWDFGEGAYPQIINGQGPHEVLYLTPGYKTVSLTIDNAYTEIKHDYIQVKDLFTFTLGIEGPGSVLVDNLPYLSPLLVPEGTTIVIQAEEDENYVFTGWCNDFSGCSNPLSITMDSDKNIVASFSYIATAFYDEGDIPTDLNFYDAAGASACAALLAVNIPMGATITSVDVSYSMLAANDGWISHQRSLIKCVSPGGIAEEVVIIGIGDVEGSMLYNRSGLDIANNVFNETQILFELHAGRTSLGSICDNNYNKVVNNTWTITVFYDLLQTSPVIVTLPLSNPAPDQVVIGGNVLYDGGSLVINRGIYWGMQPNSEATGMQLHSGYGLGEFYELIDELEPSTTYYFRAYAINESGSAYGDEYSFTTYSLPVVRTEVVTGVTDHTAQVNGEVLEDGGANVIESGVFWCTCTNPEIVGLELAISEGIGFFSAVLPDLEPSTLYYLKAYAINEFGISWGELISFETLATESIPEMLALENILIIPDQDTCYSATSTITLAGDGSYYIVESGAIVQLVAGENILLLPGVNIQAGAYLQGRIAINGDYCMNTSSMLAIVEEEHYQESFSSWAEKTSNYRVFPNPTKGSFIFEILDPRSEDIYSVKLYDMRGLRISEAVFSGEIQKVFDLTGLANGMYILNISNGLDAYNEKVIKY